MLKSGALTCAKTPRQLRQLWDSSAGFKVFMEEPSSSSRWQSSYLLTHTHTHTHTHPHTHTHNPDQISADLFQRLILNMMRFTGARGIYINIFIWESGAARGYITLLHTIGTGNRILAFMSDSYFDMETCFGSITVKWTLWRGEQAVGENVFQESSGLLLRVLYIHPHI